MYLVYKPSHTPFLTPSHPHLRPRKTWPKSSPTSFGGRLEHGLQLWSMCVPRVRSSSSLSEGEWSQLPRKEQERERKELDRDLPPFLPCRYENPEVALNCGMMLRECVRHEPLAKVILYSEEFYSFFKYVEMSTFDVASDGFATFKVRRI